MEINDKLLPSNKKFGIFFSLIFFIIFTYFLYYNYFFLSFIFFFLSATTFLLTIFFPSVLTVFNKIWFRFGILLNKLISPIILGIIFYFMITPIALLTKIFGRDELRLKRKQTKTYWIERKPPGPDSSSFKNQF